KEKADDAVLGFLVCKLSPWPVQWEQVSILPDQALRCTCPKFADGCPHVPLLVTLKLIAEPPATTPPATPAPKAAAFRSAADMAHNAQGLWEAEQGGPHHDCR